MIASPPALLGGTPAVSGDHERLFHWPIVTEEDEAAILDVLRRGVMSGTDVTIQFEQEFAAWQGRTYALAHNTGTAALHCAMLDFTGLQVCSRVAWRATHESHRIHPIWTTRSFTTERDSQTRPAR